MEGGMDSSPSLLPLVIGVTGHRDLRPEDTSDLQRSVATVLDEITAKLAGVPVVLLSPLAEGADRLVARVALDRQIALHVPLPMPIAEYETTFVDEASRKEFRELLERAEEVFEVAASELPAEWRTEASGNVRDEAYAAVGAYVVRHSQILVALWNGVDSGLAAGTDSVVRWALEGWTIGLERGAPGLDRGETALVAQIITPRVSDERTDGRPLAIRYRLPRDVTDLEQAWSTLRETCERLRSFNRDATRLAEDIPPGSASRPLLDEAASARLSTGLRRSLELFRSADTLAIRYQRRSGHTITILFVGVLLAVASFEAYSHVFTEKLPLLAAYTILLAVAFTVYGVARSREIEPRYLEYRALAEGLRVQIFWRLAGVGECVADHYLRRHRREVQWIRVAILAAGSAPEPRAVDPAVMHGRLEIVRSQWVEAQRNFYRRGAVRSGRQREYWELAARIAFWMAVILAVAELIVRTTLPAGGIDFHLMHGVIALALVIAGLARGWSEKKGFGALARRYGAMDSVFANADRQLERALREARIDDVQKLLREVGREALAENAEWLLLLRDHPLEVPGA
jgi:hypothetical protein